MKQSSSATSAVCGSSSLTQAPLWPCWANWNSAGGDREARPAREVMPVSRWPLRIESGSSVPLQVARAAACGRTGPSATGRRTGTGRSPAWPGAKWGSPASPRREDGSPGEQPLVEQRRQRERSQPERRPAAGSAGASAISADGRAAGPWAGSLLGDRLVEVQDQLARSRCTRPARPGRAAGRPGSRRRSIRARAASGSLRNSRSLVAGSRRRRIASSSAARAAAPVAARKASAIRRLGESPPSRIIRAASARAASTKVRSFSRSSACSGVLVRDLADDAGLAARGVEGRHRRRGHGPLPERVQAAAIERRAVVLDVARRPPARSRGPPAGTASPTGRRAARPAGR